MRAFVVAVALLSSATSVAQPAKGDGSQPWAVGVTDAQRKSAQTLLDAGNALFLEKKYGDALAKYREAVGVWDHPAIRFNIVRCLIQLEKYVEADENLKLALKYGAAPLEEAVYNEARNYEKLLAKQVVELEVSCTQPGVKLTLDGEPLGQCPTKSTRRIRPGRHQVVGVKAGFLTKTDEVFLEGGEKKSVDISLMPLERAAKIEHRWPTWMPWVVFGGGLTVAGIGGLVQLKASADMRSYDRDITLRCPNGCTDAEIPAETKDRKSLAELEGTIGIAVISVGAAAAVTGGVLLYMNRGRTVYPKESSQPIAIQPTVGGGLITWGGSF